MSDAAGCASLFQDADLERAAAIIARCRTRGWRLATAESCTGGLVSGLLTEVAGASAVIECGFITYSNEAKTALIGVPDSVLVQYGAVSSQTAGAMAEGALARSRSHCAVSITGIAGPGGGSDAKPVGLVHFGVARLDAGLMLVERRFGDLGRAAVRLAAVREVLSMLERALGDGADVAQVTP